jgi:homoserine O-acetyltransferase
MKSLIKTLQYFLLVFCFQIGLNAWAQNYHLQKVGIWETKNFQFHNGQSLPTLKLGYTTLGDPKNEAVVILHGTAEQYRHAQSCIWR